MGEEFPLRQYREHFYVILGTSLRSSRAESRDWFLLQPIQYATGREVNENGTPEDTEPPKRWATRVAYTTHQPLGAPSVALDSGVLGAMKSSRGATE